MKELWTEKYRPKTIDGYVFTDVNAREQIGSYIKDNTIPHLLFYGSAGTGKTTLAKILVNTLDLDSFDFLQVNASRDNGVDFLKTKIEGFVSTLPFGEFKIVLLDEADYLSHSAQAVMRGLMETYASQARFILTCNLIHKIIPPLRSRCQEFHIAKPDMTEFTARAATVLVSENIEFDLEVLDSYVKATYPDLRKCINLLQGNSTSGVLSTVKTTVGTQDYKLGVVELFKQRKFKQARELLCANFRSEELEEIYRWCYDNLNIWSDSDEGQDQAILIIKRAIVHQSLVSDQEINLAAMLIELAEIGK